MVHTIKIPLPEQKKIEFEDCFIENIKASQWIRESVLVDLGIEGKRSIQDQKIYFNKLDEFGVPAQDEIDIKDTDLVPYLMASNPDWVPTDIKREDAQSLEVKIGDMLWERLNTYAEVVSIRLEHFEKHQDAFWEQELLRNSASKVIIADARKKRDEGRATCLEAIIYVSALQKINEKLVENEKKILAKENEEILKSEKEEPKEKDHPL